MLIRDERHGDEESVRAVNLAAFDTSEEADLVDALRDHAAPVVSLVVFAERFGTIRLSATFSHARRLLRLRLPQSAG